MHTLRIAPKSVGFTRKMSLNYTVNQIRETIKLRECNSEINIFTHMTDKKKLK
jgi:hypothetical protein